MRRYSESWIALLAVTALALYLCWLIVEPFVQVLLWATVLAIITHPLQRFWRRRGWGPNLGAMATTLLVVLAVLLPLTLLTLAMVRQAVGAADGLQRFAQTLLDPQSEIYRFADRYVDLDQLRDRQFLAERAKALTGTIATRTLGFVGGIFGVILHIVFVLFTLFYLVRDGDWILPAVRDSLPLERDEADLVIARTHEVISGSIYGVLVIAAIQGTLGGLAFWALGLPSPLLWGMAMFLLSMVPLVGSSLIWAPAALYLLATGAWGRGLFLIIWGAAVIGTVDNLLRPRLVGERTRLHELVVFFSVLGGLQVFGILGLVVGPVVVALTFSLIDVIRRANKRPPARGDAVPGLPVTAATTGEVTAVAAAPPLERPIDRAAVPPPIRSDNDPAGGGDGENP
jgi:predicted PurR-regulated permease PerM